MSNDLIDNLTDNLIKNMLNGKVVSFPTETVYALSCNANDINAINKIYELKNRPKNKLFSIFVDINFLDSYVVYNSNLKDFVYNELNNGTTIIFNKKNTNILPHINSETIGIRYPKHDFTRCLLKKLGNFALVATSVNKSGKEPLCDCDKIKEQFKGIDFIVDNNLLKNSVISGKPSRIISITGNNIEIVRK